MRLIASALVRAWERMLLGIERARHRGRHKVFCAAMVAMAVLIVAAFVFDAAGMAMREPQQIHRAGAW